ncbi:hypothetical protein [Microbacterium hydrocarbonoxydans]|uniref:hypothetical protein n=1 Tax=Microbacterium hydrocarbonoxydans TaxID=273678 RepID=UPI0013DAB909|nr:hypothetical protein [Microbacterium hydrocarbonoxydans]
MASDLASVLVPIGVTGAVLAVLCAIVAAVAIVRGAGGLSGGAVGLWIPCAVLTLAAGFANQWMPLLISGVALVALLIAGGVVRGLADATAPGREASRRLAAERRAQAAAAAPVPAAVPAVTEVSGAAAVPGVLAASDVPVASGAAAVPEAPVASGAPARPTVGAALTGAVSTLARSKPAKAA